MKLSSDRIIIILLMFTGARAQGGLAIQIFTKLSDFVQIFQKCISACIYDSDSLAFGVFPYMRVDM